MSSPFLASIPKSGFIQLIGTTYLEKVHTENIVSLVHETAEIWVLKFKLLHTKLSYLGTYAK